MRPPNFLVPARENAAEAGPLDGAWKVKRIKGIYQLPSGFKARIAPLPEGGYAIMFWHPAWRQPLGSYEHTYDLARSSIYQAALYFAKPEGSA